MADKQKNSVRQGDVGPVNQQARYDNHSGDKARDRLRAKLDQKLESSSKFRKSIVRAKLELHIIQWA